MSDSLTLAHVASATSPPSTVERLPLGIARADRWLNGGLRRDAVHEFYAPATEDRAAAAAFALLITNHVQDDRPIMWLRMAGRNASDCPYAPGLVELGIDPDRIILTRLKDVPALLKASVDAVRHGGIGAIILEIGKRSEKFDLTASRRLALAAERSGAMVMMLFACDPPGASAAHTRWRVASAPSTPMMENAPGHAVFDLTLLRQRGGAEGLHIQVEWDRERKSFRTPLSGGASTVSSGGAADQSASRAA